MRSGRVRLAAAVAALVSLRLLAALAPTEPRLFGTPFGLILELAVVGVATLNVWFAVRVLLPRAGTVETPSAFGKAEEI